MVIAIPNSRSLGEEFIKLGVPYVVAFDFDESLFENISNIILRNKIFETMYEFCIEFYEGIVLNKPIRISYAGAKG